MKRDLEDCITIKDCFLWADQEWPRFWEFATQQPLTESELCWLQEDLESAGPKFQLFLDKMKEVSRIDKTTEARRLLILGAGAFVRLQNQ